jgi:hypothetical protein
MDMYALYTKSCKNPCRNNLGVLEAHVTMQQQIGAAASHAKAPSNGIGPTRCSKMT